MLLRGGRRAAEEVEVAGVADKDAAGEGVDVSDISALFSSFRFIVNESRADEILAPFH